MSGVVILGVKPYIYCPIAMTVFGKKGFFCGLFFFQICCDILVNTDFVPAAKGNKGIIIILYQKSGRDFGSLQRYN